MCNHNNDYSNMIKLDRPYCTIGDSYTLISSWPNCEKAKFFIKSSICPVSWTFLYDGRSTKSYQCRKCH